MLTYQAYVEDSTIFLVKQVLTTVPVIIIIVQILYHREDKWHDDQDYVCNCGREIELDWKYCPYCGINTKNALKIRG